MFETPAAILANVDEFIYWLKKEAEEYRRDGGLQTNFGREFSISKIERGRRLYPSLAEDEDSGGYGANARMLLEDKEILP